ncbi:hypothetical protein ABZX92_08545 [Lentzea sp. NPDC006480]|uniref:hypothetical protein n=1 Tax=Lentzea sp. NPDC006480 TaxID=3157176 RepID=UPI0033ADE17F
MSIKKIVASAGIAAGAIAALAGTAQAAPELPQLPNVDAVGKVSELGQSAGISTLHNMGGNVEMIHDGSQIIGG